MKLKTVEKAEEQFNKFVPLRERNVVDIFMADKAVEAEECVVVIIDGVEMGDYWMTKEAKTLPSVRFLSPNGKNVGTDELIEDN